MCVYFVLFFFIILYCNVFCYKMVDFFSIIVLIVGIVVVVFKVLSFFGDIIDVLRFIVDLLNEVYDLWFIFCNFELFID